MAKTIKGTGQDDYYRGIDLAELIYAYGGDDDINAGGGDDVVYGGDGNDLIEGGLGNDTLYGGAGIDAVSYAGALGEVHVDLTQGIARDYSDRANGQAYGTDKLNGFEVVIGSYYDDSIIGSSKADDLRGGAGNDVINGMGGNDTLRGDEGNDLLDGGSGFDFADYFYSDGISVDLGATGIVFAVTKDMGRDELRSIEGIIGSRSDDVMIGNGGANRFIGEAGDDVLSGKGGNDNLEGGVGNDKLTGGTGTDLMYGGEGADTFFFGQSDLGVTLASADTIGDFSSAEGDKLDLSAIDANVRVAGNGTFSFIGNAAFSGTAGELRYAVREDYTVIEGDVNGDGKADGSIVLTGAHHLTAADFVL